MKHLEDFIRQCDDNYPFTILDIRVNFGKFELAIHGSGDIPLIHCVADNLNELINKANAEAEEHLLAQKPMIGITTICVNCGNAVQYTHSGWNHLVETPLTEDDEVCGLAMGDYKFNQEEVL